MNPDKLALVTGGARGIGAAISTALARAGFGVLINHRGGTRAEVLAGALREAGCSAYPIVFDVTDRLAIERALGTLGVERLSVLVNNAGINRDNLLASTSRGEFGDVLRTNFAGAVETFRACESRLRPGGRVINIGSISGLRGGRGQSSYATSKALLLAWTQHMAQRYPPDDIRFYAVSPGPVATDMVKSAGIYRDPAATRRVPVQRFGEPEEIAALVVNLTQARASLWNGLNWVADGGFTLSMKT